MAALAKDQWKRRGHDDAVTLYRVAKSLSRTPAFYGFVLAMRLSDDNECDEARHEYELAVPLVTSETTLKYPDLQAKAEGALDECHSGWR